MDERRRFSRVPFGAAVILTNDQKAKIEGKLKNLCLKGACVEVSLISCGMLLLNEIVQFSIVLSEDEPMSINGSAEIVWVRNDQCGLYFVSMEVEYFSLLRRLIELNYTDAEKLENELEHLVQPE